MLYIGVPSGVSTFLILMNTLTKAQELFNQVHARSMLTWSVIRHFRDTFTAVAHHAEAHIESDLKATLRDIGYKSPDDDVDGFAATSKALLNRSYSSLNAAVLIFLHSLLDGVAFDLCRVTALASPEDWIIDLQDTKVSLLDVRHHSFESLLQARLNNRLSTLERESLQVKLDRLFARCQPPKDWSPLVGYSFDREKINHFDLQRIEIVHGNALGGVLNLFTVDDVSLLYLFSTATYLVRMVGEKYGLAVDVQYVLKYLQQI